MRQIFGKPRFAVLLDGRLLRKAAFSSFVGFPNSQSEFEEKGEGFENGKILVDLFGKLSTSNANLSLDVFVCFVIRNLLFYDKYRISSFSK